MLSLITYVQRTICVSRADDISIWQVLKMECQLLNDLEFHLSVPTTKTFLRLLLTKLFFFFGVGSHRATSDMPFF
jgi:hypothetical protein